jgi:hypothetical protein
VEPCFALESYAGQAGENAKLRQLLHCSTVFLILKVKIQKAKLKNSVGRNLHSGTAQFLWAI